jgi:hypothetical protein
MTRRFIQRQSRKMGLLMPALVAAICCAAAPPPPPAANYQFDGAISREVLENYLSRSITMEGLLNGRGDLDDNIRMLKGIGAKFIGRSLCLWGGESNFLSNLERARQQVPKVRNADPDMILQACVFEIVSTQVEQVPVPDWVFAAFDLPAEKRNFRYSDMLFPEGHRRNWGPNASVPDISRAETKLWFYYQAASYIDLGFEAIHFGQVELMARNDPDLSNWSHLLSLVHSYAARHARRHMVLCDGHVPSGGMVRNAQLLLDFHSFPLRIMEVPDPPQEAILKVGFLTAFMDAAKAARLLAAGSASICPIWSSWIIGASAASRESRALEEFGFGVMTKSPGLRTSPANIAPTGCITPGIGCGGRTQMAIWKCPAVAPKDRRWITGDGNTPTIRVPPSRMALATKKPFAPSGREARRPANRV